MRLDTVVELFDLKVAERTERIVLQPAFEFALLVLGEEFAMFW